VIGAGAVSSPAPQEWPGPRAPAHLLVLLALLLAACDRGPSREPGLESPDAARAAARAAKEGQRLRDLSDRYYEQFLELNPLAATAQGDHRFDDRFGDYVSTAWMADWLAIEQQGLQALAAIDPGKLAGEDLVTFEAFRHGRAVAVEGFRYPAELQPMQPFVGLHVQFPVMGSGRGIHPFRSTADYENFLARMEGFVGWSEQSIANMRLGLERGFVQPRVVVERVIIELEALAVDDPRNSHFFGPLADFPAGVPVFERSRLLQTYEEKLEGRVLPAYRRLLEFLKDEYLPQARDTVSWSELPNGAEWYAYLVRFHTSTGLTPEQVHELGLAEVARLRSRMDRMRQQLGHAGDLGSFFGALRADPAQQHLDAAELLAGYRAIEARVKAGMPLLFGTTPRAPVEIRAVEAFRASSEGATSFQGPSPDGRRPGVFYVNAHDLPSRPKYLMEALYLNAAVPGHLHRISVAQEAEGLPRFRRFASDTAFGEGWALYAVTLGLDLGLYTDPQAAFGALATEMGCATGLVVDTGLHARDWTRAQATDYLRANTPMAEADIAAQIARHIARPGEAVACKVGELKIQELRRRAEVALGPRFDIRAFHAQVIEGGALPLAVLEARIDRWIAAQAQRITGPDA
jgi:uncharacterized protein (DUF885 family)